MEPLEPLDALATATLEFASRLRQVQQDQWDAPTPCEGWTVTDLVSHVVGGNASGPALLAGATAEEAMTLFGGVGLGDDPVATYEAGAEAQIAAFSEAGAMERICSHPLGNVPGRDLIGFRIGDLTAHAWDLARAIGADETLDPQLVETAWTRIEPMAPILGSLGIFGEGTSGAVTDDATPQHRLLDAMGRRP